MCIFLRAFSTARSLSQATLQRILPVPIPPGTGTPDHPERPGRVRAIMNALMRNFPDTRVMLAPEAEIEQVRYATLQAITTRECDAPAEQSVGRLRS